MTTSRLFIGDDVYVGADRYILRQMGRLEMAHEVDMITINAFNQQHHAGYRVRVHGGVGYW